jgi:hypothetical protein
MTQMAELGSAKIKRTGPGDDVAPKATAAIKSVMPMTFQVHRSFRSSVAKAGLQIHAPDIGQMLLRFKVR